MTAPMKTELDLINTMRESTANIERGLEFAHYLAIAQIILLALILWRVW